MVTSIREAVEASGRSQASLSVEIGHHRNWLGRVLRGAIKDVKQRDIAELARVTGHPIDLSALQERRDLVRIPVIQEGSASLKGGVVVEHVYMPRSDIAGTSEQHLIGYKAQNECIAPDIIEGDTVVLDTSATARPGDIVAVAIGGELHLRRYRQRGSHHVVHWNEGETTIEPHQIEGVMLGFYRQRRR